jgi:dephospho-CoA kinase
MAPRILIGLTGNIATGKSAVAARLRELGATIIDADQVSREVVQKGRPALQEIVRTFGPQVLHADGELDRKALGQVVFNDAQKLKQLEQITHPAVHVEIQRQLDELPADAVAVIEVIKLIESGWADRCDSVWVTDCPPADQVNRLMRSRGMSEAEARARVAAQNPQAEKLARADVVINTSGTFAQTRKQVTQAWDGLMAPDDPPAAPVAIGVSAMPLPAPAPTSGATQAHGPALEWFDWLVRLVIWGISVVVFASQLHSPLSLTTGAIVLLFALLMAGFLVASIAPVAERLFGAARAQPLWFALLPLVLLGPYVWYTRQNGSFDTADLLTAGVLLFLPTALALLNTPALNGPDVVVGLVGVAAPLVVPIIRYQTLDGTGILLRLGAFALPVLLLLFTTRQQKNRLNFLFISAVLSLWYAVEFNVFPSVTWPVLGRDLSYFHLAVIPLFLYVLASTGRFRALGLSLQPVPRDMSIVATNLVIFLLIAIPLGLITHFLTLHFAAPPVGEVLGQALTIYLFVALPEEILFRGTLLSYLDETLRWPTAATIIVSALLFGAAHLNTTFDAGWYVALAALAGVFYARTYLQTRNVGTSATLHAAVNLIWVLLFGG